MSTKVHSILVFSLAALGLALFVTITGGVFSKNVSLVSAGAPSAVSYQGEVQIGGAAYTGDGYFKFAVVNAAGNTTYWSNDGSSSGGNEPSALVVLSVNDGLFHVLLGDPAHGGMTQPLTADVFDQPERYLRVWFSENSGGPFAKLSPDTRITAVPYALQAQVAVDADTVDGLHADAFADATHNHAPGDISPQGTGSGLDADTVDGLHANELKTHYQNVVIVAKSGGDYTGVQAALDSITDATADNPYLVWVAPGVYDEQVAMKPFVHLQGAGQEATIITNDVYNASWPPTQATLELANDTTVRDLTVVNDGSVGSYKIALLATAGTARTWVADITTKAMGSGGSNYGIFLTGNNTAVSLQQVNALGESGSQSNYGLYVHGGAIATVHGGFFTGHWGMWSVGIRNYFSTIDAKNVTALGQSGTFSNFGLENRSGAVTLFGGSFTGRGGNSASGIYNTDPTASLQAESVAALGEGSSNNSGVSNKNSAGATLYGGTFTGRGGTEAAGILNENSGTTVDINNATVLGENGSDNNYGLRNYDAAGAALRSGTFTGRGGVNAYGIYNGLAAGTLDAANVSTIGEGGSGGNYGLYNDAGVPQTSITQSVLQGSTYSVYRAAIGGGSLYVSHSQLVDGAANSALVTCTAVSRNTTFNANGCP